PRRPHRRAPDDRAAGPAPRLPHRLGAARGHHALGRPAPSVLDRGEPLRLPLASHPRPISPLGSSAERPHLARFLEQFHRSPRGSTPLSSHCRRPVSPLGSSAERPHLAPPATHTTARLVRRAASPRTAVDPFHRSARPASGLTSHRRQGSRRSASGSKSASARLVFARTERTVISIRSLPFTKTSCRCGK